MKKVLFLAALALISAGSFAQKKNVSIARNRAMAEDNPDFVGARAAIKEALENEETKSLPNTYFVAGLIGFQENAALRNAAYIGKSVDNAHKAEVLNECYDYFIKALEMAKQPISMDKKGNPKFDKTTPKDIAAKLAELFQNADFYYAGLEAYNSGKYAEAYNNFMLHLGIPEIPVMAENPKLRELMPIDSVYYQIKYYTGVAAVQAEMHPEAIAIFEAMKNGEVEPLRCYLNLYNEYVAMKDTVNYVRTLQEGMSKFPEEISFLQYLINHYIYSGQTAEAINYLQKAIDREPNNAQYIWIMGNLHANEDHFDAAIADYTRALEIDPSMADAHAGIGRVFCNQARVLNENSDGMTGKEYKAVLDQMQELYRKAMPYFEKAHELMPEERDYMRVLSMLYDRFDMTEKRDAINAQLGY